MEIRLLGPFEALRNDEPVAGLTGRVRTLLAVLALAVPESVSVDAIGQRLWGDDPPANLRPSVHTTVARLRTLLAPDVQVDTTAGGYALRIDPERVDVLRFVRLLEDEQLAGALGLWRGEPFGGVRSDWLEREQAPRLTETYLSATERWVDLELAAGRHDGVLPLLRELTAKHPLRESLWLRLLTALSRSGRPAEALTLYDELRRRLAEELGVDPAAELRAVHAELLAATEPKRARPGNVAPRQLPPGPARFTGRTQALDRLETLSAATGTGEGAALTILAVHGPGGVGKTSLALHWSHRAAEHFPDGQLYLNLQGYGPGEPTDPDVALDILLRGLGLTGAQIPERGPARTAMLRTVLADRRVLLLLDNARDAEQVRPLLPGPGCLVLVTSRSQLRSLAAREGARRVALDRFGPDEAAAYLTATFEPHQVEASSAETAELAELCGQLPLALAIAAERVTREPAAGVQALIGELRDHPDRLRVLDVDEDDDGALRAVFDWSYRVLAPEQARLFRLLALQPAQDFGVEAVAALAATSRRDAAQRLDGLVGAHLVEQAPGDRFQLHDLLRAYSIGLPEEPSVRREARGRVLEWYVHSALSGKSALDRTRPLLDFGVPAAGLEPLSFSDAPAAAAWFTRERQALVAAVHDAERHGHHTAAYRLAAALWPYLVYARALDDIFDTQQVALRAAQLSGDTAAEAATAHNAGRAYFQRGDLEQSFKHLDRSLTLFELIGDDRGRGWALTDLGRLYRRTGDPRAAIAHHQRAIVALRGADDPIEEARNHSNLATNYLAVGDPHEAVRQAERAVALNRAVGEQRAVAFSLDTLATARLATGADTAAVHAYEESLELSRALQDRWGEISTLTNLGRALHSTGDLPAARTHWQTALTLFESTGIPDTPDHNRATLRALLNA
ncbi:BTAD domain-containing putative transcriptional regulator [Kribbella sp. NPDC051770]|uniref:AfsR/SARP family transcriptional regulator n=1 Tax=Kribbella sp. NPDC051770 TaxID=3155413 RepID=UPI00342190B3